MRIKPITVNDLYLSCKKEIEKGNGDKHVFTYDDDEGNGVHACWYLLDDSDDNLNYYKDDIERDGCEKSDVILFG